ncbi:MAG TPA: DinB family protein [Pseudonocardiaceae bacterium]|jgi:uncharacterized damage-inducible protein DinB|nr:DinB family protein [Pseudonocardiaceae bacterium]
MTSTTTWTAPTPAAVEGPLVGEDRPILEGYLRWQRSVLLGKCAGLTGEQLARRAIAPSNLSLLGLVRHLAKVERTWLRQRIAGQQFAPMYDPALGVDADFDDLDPARAAEDHERLVTEGRLAAEAVAATSFDHTIEVRGETLSLRAVYLHLIAEYARHNGHADLLREVIDGRTGD